MDADAVRELAALLAERNAVDARIAALIGRPALPGHVGEWLAAEVFDIELAASAIEKGIDGWFRGVPQPGASVNIKLYGKREGILDLTQDNPPDFYLVITGPRSQAGHSRGAHRPLQVDAIYLFETAAVVADIRARAAARARTPLIGTASSVRSKLWQRAEVYPHATNAALALSDEQIAVLALFASGA
jgi:hypothetical protein